MYTCLFVISLTSVVFLTSYFVLSLWLSLAMSFWPDPDLPVSTVSHADLEGAQTPRCLLVFCVAFCPSTSVVQRYCCRLQPQLL